MHAVVFAVFSAEKIIRVTAMVLAFGLHAVIQLTDITAGTKGFITGTAHQHRNQFVAFFPAFQLLVDQVDHGQIDSVHGFGRIQGQYTDPMAGTGGQGVKQNRGFSSQNSLLKWSQSLIIFIKQVLIMLSSAEFVANKPWHPRIIQECYTRTESHSLPE